MTPDEQTQDTRPTFEDVAEALAVVRENDDTNHWAAGDLSAAWLAQVAEGEKVEELKQLASASGFTYSRLRERVDCSVFWPEHTRRWEMSWSHYNRARRGTDLSGAKQRMQHAAEEALSPDAFEKWIHQGDEVGSLPTPTPTLAERLDALHAEMNAIILDEATPLEVVERLKPADIFVISAKAEAVKATEAGHRPEGGAG